MEKGIIAISGDGLGEVVELLKAFVAIVIKSPPALVALMLSSLCGYGICFVLFDYRRTKVHKSHIFYHSVIGLGYSAVVFCAVNYDILSRNLTADDISRRIPLTLLISFGIAFLVMMAGGVYREYVTPYASGERNGNHD